MRYLLCLLVASLFVSSAQGQAFIPTASSSGGIEVWEEMQVGVTMVGSQSTISPVGGASALYFSRYIQSAYVGPSFLLSDAPARFALITSVGMSRIAPSSLPLSDTTPAHVYSPSSMIGLVIQDDARALLIGMEYSSGYELSSKQNRPHVSHYDHAQQHRFVLGFGWSL